MKATPSQLLALEGYLPDRPGHALARCFVVGGEALMWEDVSRWRVLAPQARIVNEYGPTETVVGSCVYEAPERHGIGPVPIGRPIANTRVYIVDRWGQLAPTTSTGELYIGGIGVARGYCGQPALTAERFLPDAFGTDPGARLYRTGDLARWNSHGQIEYLGRLDDQIKLRGYRIELGEIEAVLRQHGAVHQCAVVLLEGTARKQLVCYAVRKSGTAITGPELLQYLAGKLPEYMIPSAMVLLESLPLTPNGKVDRKALPRPSMGTGSSREYVAPRTPAEELLAGIWGQALRLTRVGVHDNFFELGGDSILTIQIVSRANQAGLRIAPRDMFQNQTIAELASVAAKVQAIESSTVATGTLPLTPIQQWFFEQNIHRPQHFNQSALLKPSHDLKSGQVMAALRSVLDHHDVLRTRFSYDEEKWKQRTGAEETNTVYTFVDLSALDAGCQPSAIEMAAGELQASLDFERGPLLRMAQFQLGLQEPGRLLIILHHLIVDAVSWSILLEDFEMALDQIQRGETVRLAEKTTSFRQWVLALEKYADSPELLQESAIWTAMETASVAPLPRDYKEGNNTAGSARTISLRLTAEQTQILLQEAPRTHRIQIEEVILAALARALCEWAGQPVVAVHVEGHGREDIQPEINLTRTVGWFTTLHPALLTIAQDANAEQQLRDIKEQLRAIPRRGLGFGVLRYVAKGPVREILTRVPTPEVSFNYLGNAALGRSEAFTSAPETPGATQSSEASRFHTFDVTAAIDNGRLLVIWTYSENLHSSTTVQRIAGRFQAAVEDYLTCLESFPAAGPSPADFPLSGLDREQLESVLQQFKQHVRSQKA
jgi:non-ribosomal peptide synthase protein (TIGR01720 family)